MGDHNSKVTFKADPQIRFDAENCMPFYTAKIELQVLLDPQHDGHLWPQEFVDGEESALVEEILAKMRSHVARFVKESKPFSVHGPT